MKTLKSTIIDIKYILLGIVVIGGLVVGCSSFNNIGNTYQITLPPVKTTSKDDEVTYPPTTGFTALTPGVIDTGVKQVEATIKPCMEDPFPELPKTPPVPTKKQLAAAGDDIVLLELIEREHIAALQAHSLKVRKLWNDARLAYMAKCINPIKK